MLVFFDTEFSDLGIDPRLVSIGLVSENGERTFYAELSDTYQVKDCGEFTKLVVLPLLEGGDKALSMHELTLRLGNWLEDFDEPVTLATDSLSWDWPWIQEIFYIDGTWPANVARRPLLLSMNYLNDYDCFIEAVEKAFSSLRRHHSLDDAKANRLGWIAAGGDTDQVKRRMRDAERCIPPAEAEGALWQEIIDDPTGKRTWVPKLLYDAYSHQQMARRGLTEPKNFGIGEEVVHVGTDRKKGKNDEAA